MPFRRYADFDREALTSCAMRSARMNIEEAVAAATDGAATLLSCLGDPVVAYHVTAIMREADAGHALEMQHELGQRTVDALVADGLDDAAAVRFASVLEGRVGRAWRRLHSASSWSH